LVGLSSILDETVLNIKPSFNLTNTRKMLKVIKISPIKPSYLTGVSKYDLLEISYFYEKELQKLQLLLKQMVSLRISIYQI